MSSVYLVNSSVLNVKKGKIHQKLEVFEGNRAAINVVIGRDHKPMVLKSARAFLLLKG